VEEASSAPVPSAVEAVSSGPVSSAVEVASLGVLPSVVEMASLEASLGVAAKAVATGLRQTVCSFRGRGEAQQQQKASTLQQAQ